LFFVLCSPPALLAQVTCTASNTTVNFGSYDVLSGAVLDVAGTFTVTCTNGFGLNAPVTYTAKLATTPAKQMAPPSGTDRLTYAVYTDAARTQPWGDGTGGTFTITGSGTIPARGSFTDTPKNYYGRVTPGGQDVSSASPGPPPTTYSQTLTVTVTCVIFGGFSC
jgi:spore coat protein U-like protein